MDPRPASSPTVPDEDSLVYANGVNAATGEYLLPPLRPETICKVAEGKPLDPAELKSLESVYRAEEDTYLAVTFGVDPTSLASAGWGIVFAQGAPVDELREALSPLLEMRKAQAGPLYHEFSGEEGYFADETSLDFLARFGAGPGPVRPTVLPYYLLLVGDPTDISFDFQYQLDVIHSVGRICFDTLEEYRAYANAVVRAETAGALRERSIGFFAPRNPGDVATRRSSENLVRKLAADLRATYGSWHIEECVGEEATKAELKRMLGGKGTPSLLFTASHGVGFPSGHPLQRDHQGALLCQDWPGPLAGQNQIPPEQYFSAADVADATDLSGTVAFFFACYGNGTPELDEFDHGDGDVARIAPSPFVSRLSMKLLSRGALAVIGHVDRAWGWSFTWPRAGTQIETFRATVEGIMAGQPVGCAVEYFNERYATISSELTNELQKRRRGKMNDTVVTGLWTANNDARNYTILGDPAVRLAFPLG
jgi:hypothetical protein